MEIEPQSRIAVIVGPNRIDKSIADIIFSHRHTIMFEPLPEACRFMAEQIEGDGLVTIVQAACGAEDGRSFLNVYNEYGASSSLGTCGSDAVNLYDGQDLSCRGVIEVDVVNLNHWLIRNRIHRVHTLVTDAQGMDLTIIKTMQEWFDSSRIHFVQCEADGGGFAMYDGLPDNSEEGFDNFFTEHPQYRKSKLPDRVPWNPDLVWSLKNNS